MCDFLGFNLGILSIGGIAGGCFGSSSISLLWEQQDNWLTRERPAQLKANKLDILNRFTQQWKVILTHFSAVLKASRKYTSSVTLNSNF